MACKGAAGQMETQSLRAWLPGKGLLEENLFRLLKEIGKRNEGVEASGTEDEDGTSV